MYVLSLKGHKLVDDSLSTSIVLCDIQLDDIRPNRENKLTRFMNRRETKNLDSIDVDSVVRSMLDIVFNQSKDDMFAEVKVSGFDLILSLDFLLKISSFFQVQAAASTTSIQSSKINENRSPVHQVVVVKPPTPTAPAEPAKRMTIILNVEQPEIILVEAMDDINCHALILNVSSIFIYFFFFNILKFEMQLKEKLWFYVLR